MCQGRLFFHSESGHATIAANAKCKKYAGNVEGSYGLKKSGEMSCNF
jgi:hypothetical protein